jgi:hypothetical protein
MPARRLVTDWISIHRPPSLRKLAFPVKVRLREASLMSAKDRIAHFKALVKHEDWLTERLISFDKLLEPRQIKRLLTIEYFCAKTGMTV